jgi:hypothetical protein
MSASAADVGRKVIWGDGWRVTMHVEVRRGPLQGPDCEHQGPTNRMSAAMFSGSPHRTRATISDRPSAKSPQKQPTKRPNAKVNAVSQHQDQPFREMQHGRHWRHCSPGHHRTMPALREDHAAAGRPTQRLRNPTDGRSAQRSERRNLRLSDQWRAQSPRRPVVLA